MPALICVVDDDRAWLALVTEVLLMAGYAVTAWPTSTGLAALLARLQPALLIADLYLPGDLAGADLVPVARAAGYTGPVLFMSALARHGASVGGHSFLPKMLPDGAPFADRLVARVALLLAREGMDR